MTTIESIESIESRFKEVTGLTHLDLSVSNFKREDDNKKETFIQRLVKRMEEVNAMFDYVVTNPPYAGSLHLSFFELGLNHMRLDELGKKCGQMTIIEPATWLINIRKYDNERMSGKNVKQCDYDLIQGIKEKIKCHVKKVVIENFNKDFSIADYHPLSITTIDFSKTYDTIEFECCGEKKIVNSLYDCNLIGSYDTIWSILNKVLAYNNMMDKHVFKKNSKVDANTKYLRYWNYQMYGLGSNYGGVVKQYLDDSNALQRNVASGRYMMSYVASAADGDICNNVVVGAKGNMCDCVYGTRGELENWKHFIFNNKLPLFINIVLTIGQNNNSKEFLPWIVDKKYTDEEIYAKFNLTKDEIVLIDETIKKFERNSPWFERYMCGNSNTK